MADVRAQAEMWLPWAKYEAVINFTPATQQGFSLLSNA